MEPTVDELAKNYSQFSDEKLIKIATEEILSIRKDAQLVLLNELSKRPVPKEAIEAIEIQLSISQPEALNSMVEFVRQIPCPTCGMNDKKLNATKVETVFSLIVLSDRVKELRIACPDCLDKHHLKGILFTFVFGWWAIPGGLYKPFLAFWSNYKMKKLNHATEVSPIMKLFVKQNIAKIKLNENNSHVLRKILAEAFLENIN